jgi:hypothetical protein
LKPFLAGNSGYVFGISLWNLERPGEAFFRAFSLAGGPPQWIAEIKFTRRNGQTCPLRSDRGQDVGSQDRQIAAPAVIEHSLLLEAAKRFTRALATYSREPPEIRLGKRQVHPVASVGAAADQLGEIEQPPGQACRCRGAGSLHCSFSEPPQAARHCPCHLEGRAGIASQNFDQALGVESNDTAGGHCHGIGHLRNTLDRGGVSEKIPRHREAKDRFPALAIPGGELHDARRDQVNAGRRLSREMDERTGVEPPGNSPVEKAGALVRREVCQ